MEKSISYLCGNKYSAFFLDLYDYLDYKDIFAISLTCKLISVRCKERSVIHLRNFNVWKCYNYSSLDVIRKFIKGFVIWMNYKLNMINSSITFILDISPMLMNIIVTRNTNLLYTIYIEFESKNIFFNPICTENGLSVLQYNMNMSDLSGYTAYIKSLNIFLPILPKLIAISRVVIPVKIDGIIRDIVDMRTINVITGNITCSNMKIACIIYHLFVGLARDVCITGCTDIYSAIDLFKYIMTCL